MIRAAIRRSRLWGATAVPVVGLVAALASAAPAQAIPVPNRPFAGVAIGGLETVGEHQEAKLDAPCGVAVDSTGTALVSDYYRQVIRENTPQGLVNVPFFSAPVCALASDPTGLYANVLHGPVINVGLGQIDPGPATGIALDPLTARLYVDHRTSIAVYQSPVAIGDAPIAEIDPGTGGPLEDGYGVAVSIFPATEGWVYVADAANDKIKVYDPATSTTQPIDEIDGLGTEQGRFVSLEDASLTIDQTNGHLLVVDNLQPGFEHPLASIVEFNAEGVYRGTFERTVVDGEPTGIAVDETLGGGRGNVYVTSGNGASAAIPPVNGPPLSEAGALLLFGPAGLGHLLEVSTSGAGQGSVKSSPAGIDCPGSCKAEMNSGQTVKLTATPAAGSVFVGWSGACSGTGACSVPMEATAAVDAEFDLAPEVHGGGVVGSPDAPAAVAAATAAALQSGASTPLSLGRATASGPGTVLLHASLLQAGTLSADGRGVKAAKATVDVPSTVALRLRLDRSGRRALRRSHGRLPVVVDLDFTPDRGAAPSLTTKRTVTFKRTAKGPR